MNKVLADLKIISSSKENSLVKNLTKVPPREPRDVMPHTTAFQPFAAEQADLLFLPNDDGYRYLLVVVDIATRLCDAEPIKNKEAATVRDAMKKIFKRKVLKMPLRLEVDPGNEFKGAFKTFYEKLLHIVTKVAGRHRQQAVVETKNYQIGKVLNARMLSEEINNNLTSRSWVDIVPQVVKSINQHFSHKAETTDINAPIRTNKFSSTLLPIGTKVRYQLDNPENYDGTKLTKRLILETRSTAYVLVGRWAELFVYKVPTSGCQRK